MFSEFGAPIIEGFDSGDSSSSGFVARPDCTTTSDGTIMCPPSGSSSGSAQSSGSGSSSGSAQPSGSGDSSSDSSGSETSDSEEGEFNEDTTEDPTETPTVTTTPPTESGTTDAYVAEEETAEEDSADDEDDDDDNDPTATTESTENFFGGEIEHFSNQEIAQKATSMNTILKAVMITCLFYVLAHKDAKKYIMGNIFKKVKGENYLYIAMVIFFIVFYIISVFL